MWAASLAPIVSISAASSPPLVRRRAQRFRVQSSAEQHQRKKVVVVGAGWAGLASAHHLLKQGFDVTLLEAGGFPTPEVGIRGFWYPYRNIFSLVDELGIQPFTKWTKSAHYSPEGMEVQFPVFQNQPQLPTPFGAIVYPQFLNLPLLDRLTSVPLIAAVIDFDNTDSSWRKYDPITSRELLKQFGCSEMLFRKAFEPLLQAGLFAPAEQCSAAATLAMLYYYFLSHQIGDTDRMENLFPIVLAQKNFDVVWCRGTIREKIFLPWLKSMTAKGLKFLEKKTVTDVKVDEGSGCISEILCGEEIYKADAFVLAVGVTNLQSTIMSSAVLQSQQEFLNVLNLSTIDVVSVRLWFDKKVNLPNAANICFGFDDSISWTFFDLNTIYDEFEDEPATILEAEFYYANQLLHLKDDEVVAKVLTYLSSCVTEFREAIVVRQSVSRFPNSATHFFPGSYRYMMRGSTSFPNLFMAGDWIINRHGSWSQEKAYVTGLEAANRVVDFLGEGEFAKIIAIEEDEPHIQTLRILNRNFNETKAQLPLSSFFLQ